MNDFADDLLAALAPIVKELKFLGVTYYVAGSAASSNYGVARSTLDVDLVADLSQVHVAPLVEALQEDYYIDARMITDAIECKSCFNVIHLSTSFKVDVFAVKDRDYDRVAMQRIRKDSLDRDRPSEEYFQAAPEDIVLSKLEWFRLGNEVSEKQWGDILGVLRVQASALDRCYLAGWAAKLEVADLLERAFSEAESLGFHHNAR